MRISLDTPVARRYRTDASFATLTRTPPHAAAARQPTAMEFPVLLTLAPRRLARALVASAALVAPVLACIAAVPATQDYSPMPADEAAQDRGWPRDFDAPEHTVRIFQPQVESWPDFARVTFRAALGVTPKKDPNEVVYGTILVSADTQVSMQDRLVVLTNRSIDSITFPGIDPDTSERLRQVVINAAPPERPQTIALDRLVTQVDPDKVKLRTEAVNIAPPKIITSTGPAIMVIFMGKPRFKPVPDSDLMFAVNTNWDVFLDPASGSCFLMNDGAWLTTKDLENGPWSATTNLPASLWKLPDNDNWNDVRAAIPAKPLAAAPKVFVSREPADLLVLDGDPEFTPVPGCGLMLVSNTEDDLFYLPAQRTYFLLSAGRWFKAPAVTGPWAAASDTLPDDFKKIPDDSDAADVLASVPGTAAAKEAAVMASIPEKAVVSRADAKVSVVYQGAPQFQPIDKTTVQYATNTPSSVLLVDGSYYCCENAVWFSSSSPTGPWVVCDMIPAAIYSIPPSSPLHNVTYVRVYDATPTTVTTGYTAGYSGATVAATGVVMFGLGLVLGAAIADDNDCCWAYRYNPCVFSYGCGAVWHGGCGGYVCSTRWYGPYGGAGRWAAYNPSTGIYSRGGYAYGPAHASGYRAAYNPSTGVSAARAGGVNPYGSWGRSAVTNGDQWVRAGHNSSARGTVSGVQSSSGAAAVRAQDRWGNGATVAKSRDGDVYAGRDGNVYKRTDSGWQQVGGQNRPTPYNDASGDLQRSAANRDRADYSASRARPSTQRSASSQRSSAAPRAAGRRGRR
jgi:hypothetical protein